MHGGVSAGGDHEHGHGHDHGEGWKRVESVSFTLLFVGAILLAYVPKAAGFGWVAYQWTLVVLWAVAYLVVEYGDLPHRLPESLVGTIQPSEHEEHAD